MAALGDQIPELGPEGLEVGELEQFAVLIQREPQVAGARSTPPRSYQRIVSTVVPVAFDRAPTLSPFAEAVPLTLP